MASITLIETLKINENNIPLAENQLIHFIDNEESKFDVSATKRVMTGKVVYLSTEANRQAITNPITNGLYFVKATNILYKYSNNWIIQSDNFELIFKNNLKLNYLVPVTLEKNGVPIAPRTVIDAIYNSEGLTLKEIINSLLGKESQDSTVTVPATVNHQTTFDIPYPFTPYDLQTNIMIILYKDKIIDPESYTLSSDLKKVTLSMEIPIGESITFKFFYANTDQETNANSINNIRIFLSKPAEPRPFDIVFNLFQKKIEQFDGTEWQDIGSANSLLLKTNIQVITESASTISIGIPEFDKSQDSLLTFFNTTIIPEEKGDGKGEYTISSDSKTIIKKDGQWEAAIDEPAIVITLCFKNVPSLNGQFNGNDIMAGTIQEEALAQSIRDKINRDFALKADLEALLDGIPTEVDTFNKLYENIITLIDSKFTNTQDSVAELMDLINNKVIIVVETIDDKSVNGQTITITNNQNNHKDYYTLQDNNHIITLNISKFTSYTVSVDRKSGYLTPVPITFNSGHLGDISSTVLTYVL